MTEQHECEWEVYETELVWCPVCKKVLLAEDIIRFLNEYETLKRATEALSAEDARMASSDTCYPDMWPDSVVPSLQTYADTLEGK